MTISKDDFADCFEKFKGYWDNCVMPQGGYFGRVEDIIALSWSHFVNINWMNASEQTLYIYIMK